jgi:KEOPS complex subunit Pcc1
MKALKRVETQFEIEFHSKKEAGIVLSAIKPEISDSPSPRAMTEIECHNKILRININAQDSPSLRASLNSYLRWVILAQQVLELNDD